jgi:hypothetical protein
MSIKEERVDFLRPKGVDWRSESWNDEWFPLPGEAVGTLDDFDHTYGIVVFSPHDYKSDVVVVLWSVRPDLQESLANKLAQQISDEVDAEILRDLMAANNA